MKTTPTTGGEAPSPEAEALPTLPVVGWRHLVEGHGWMHTGGSLLTGEQVIRAMGGMVIQAEALTPHAPAEAAIVALRAEVAELRKERDELRAARFAYASEFPFNEDGEPDVGSIHANIRALKAKQIDTDAVMRLADDYAGENYKAARFGGHYCHDRNAAREALRASLLGDGGTL